MSMILRGVEGVTGLFNTAMLCVYPDTQPGSYLYDWLLVVLVHCLFNCVEIFRNLN